MKIDKYYHLYSKKLKVVFEEIPNPVRRGWWIEKDEDQWVCSFCGARNCYAYVGHTLQDKYCPNCGAKMEGEE